MAGDVRFIRVRGRIVPVRAKANRTDTRRTVQVPLRDKPNHTLHITAKRTTVGSRFKSGFKMWGSMGASVGGVLGGVGGAAGGFSGGGSLRSRIAGAALGGLGGAAGAATALGLKWGLTGGVARAALGARWKVRGRIKANKPQGSSV